MTTIRIGNDITIRATVTRQGEAEDFTGKELALVLRSPYERIELPFTRVDNVLTAQWLGSNQTKTGRYTLTLIETASDGSGSKFTTDECGILELVPASCSSSSCGCSTSSTVLTGAQTIDIDLDVTLPANGLSAYEVAVKNGFEGTEEEWLESLKGADGKDGTNGTDGADGKDGADGTSVSVKASSVSYAVSAEATTPPTDGWQDSVPEVADGSYLWSKTYVEYSDGTSTTTYGVSAKGEQGEQGGVLYPTFHIGDDMVLYMDYDEEAGDASERIKLDEESGQLVMTI